MFFHNFRSMFARTSVDLKASLRLVCKGVKMNSEGNRDNQSVVFFYQSAKILKLCGLWQDSDHLNVRKRNVTGALVLLVSGFAFSTCGFLGYLDMRINGDIVDRQKSLIISSAILLCSIKLYSLWSSVGEIKQCLEWLQTFSDRFHNQTFIKYALRLYRMFFIIGELVMVFNTILFVCLPLLENTRMLPIPTKNPVLSVDISKSPAYEIFYFHQTVSAAVLGISMLAGDTLFCGVLILIAAFLKTINALFEENFLNGSEINLTDKKKEKVMIQIIEYYIETTSIIDFVENTFSLMSLSSLVFNMIVTGLALYLTTLLSTSSALFWFMVVTLFIEIFQLGIYCFFGEAIVTQNTILCYNIYQCDWYNQTPSFKTMILLTLQRTQREPFITCGKLVPLCNETFAEILKMAYSMCTFLYSFKES